AERIAAEAAARGEERRRAERALAELLVQASQPLPEGYLWLEPKPLAAAPAMLAAAALARALRMVGARALPPRGERLRELLDPVIQGKLGGGRPLAGCRLVPRGNRVLVVREAERAEEEILPRPGVHLWDRRFTVTLPDAAAGRAWRLKRTGSGRKAPRS